MLLLKGVVESPRASAALTEALTSESTSVGSELRAVLAMPLAPDNEKDLAALEGACSAAWESIFQHAARAVRSLPPRVHGDTPAVRLRDELSALSSFVDLLARLEQRRKTDHDADADLDCEQPCGVRI
jgi:hypothetical protein